MMLSDAVAVVLLSGVVLYAVLGGADFGAGFWDLVAGGPERGAKTRKLIAHAIGPVWEANHVWLIFGLVILWTGFPTAFTSVMTTLYFPLLLAAFGIIFRGAGFVFRKAMTELSEQRVFGIVFAGASVATPVCLGMIVGGVASGRVPAGNAMGDPWTSWWNPTSLLGGAMALATCAHLAAVYLTVDAQRAGEEELAEEFRRKALTSGFVLGGLSLLGILVLRADAEELFDGLTHRALFAMILAALGGLGSLFSLRTRRYRTARFSAPMAVAAVIVAWGLGQYPDLLPGSLTVAEAASPEPALRAILWALGVGAVFLVPSLWLLFWIFQRERPKTDPLL